MRMTQAEVIAHEERVARSRKPQPMMQWQPADRETGEGGLHEKITEYCNKQWPRWKYIHSRTDKRSRVEVGSHDFTIFMSKGRTLCVECKAKRGKLTVEQTIWRHEMATLGHTVHVAYSFEQFLELTK